MFELRKINLDTLSSWKFCASQKKSGLFAPVLFSFLIVFIFIWHNLMLKKQLDFPFHTEWFTHWMVPSTSTSSTTTAEVRVGTDTTVWEIQCAPSRNCKLSPLAQNSPQNLDTGFVRSSFRPRGGDARNPRNKKFERQSKRVSHERDGLVLQYWSGMGLKPEFAQAWVYLWVTGRIDKKQKGGHMVDDLNLL